MYFSLQEEILFSGFTADSVSQVDCISCAALWLVDYFSQLLPVLKWVGLSLTKNSWLWKQVAGLGVQLGTFRWRIWSRFQSQHCHLKTERLAVRLKGYIEHQGLWYSWIYTKITALESIITESNIPAYHWLLSMNEWISWCSIKIWWWQLLLSVESWFCILEKFAKNAHDHGRANRMLDMPSLSGAIPTHQKTQGIIQDKRLADEQS